MPAWMEVMINVIGYAGFVGVAMFNKAQDRAEPVEPRRSGGVN